MGIGIGSAEAEAEAKVNYAALQKQSEEEQWSKEAAANNAKPNKGWKEKNKLFYKKIIVE
jgi:hypothetical protein